jgi:lysozyme
MKKTDWLLLTGALAALFVFLRFTEQGKNIMQQITQAGIDAIAKLEGFSATPYNDPKGSDKWSIGYGHQIQPDEHFTSITVEQGKQLLAQDTRNAQEAVKRNIHVALTTAQFDALTSFVYNIGIHAFESGTVPAKINAGDYAAAAATMREYNKAGGKVNLALVARRALEASAFA